METNTRIAVTCPACERRSSVAARFEGRKIKCASCHAVFRVPVESGSSRIASLPITAPRVADAAPAPGGSQLLLERHRVRLQALVSAITMTASLGLFLWLAMRGFRVPVLVLPIVASVVVLARACLRLDAIEKVLDSSDSRQESYERRVRKTQAVGSQA